MSGGRPWRDAVIKSTPALRAALYGDVTVEPKFEPLSPSDQVVAVCQAYGDFPVGSTHREAALVERLRARGYEIVRRSGGNSSVSVPG